MLLVHFPARAAVILFLSIFGHKIDVLKSSALFQGNKWLKMSLLGCNVTRAFSCTCTCDLIFVHIWA